MPPNVTGAPTDALLIGSEKSVETKAKGEYDKRQEYKVQLVWRNIIFFSLLHLSAVYGVYLIFTSAKIATTLFATILFFVTCFGITAGAHRLWAHRSYQATWQLRLLLVMMNTMAYQNSVICWSRDHRLHHKYSDTNADPHNAKRGFFFSHIGWLLCRKHPDVKEKGKGIDLSDLYSDPVLRFQKKYYGILMPLMCFILPTVIPVYLWNETWLNAFFIPTQLRYACALNVTWLVNSAAHLYGNKPYDRFINPAQNKTVAILALGEGWHNYHHTFPWDYKTSELGDYWINATTPFIDFFARIGWAYDLKTCSAEMVKKRISRTGDGSHEVWGWGDKDQTQKDKEDTCIMNSQ